MMKRILATTLSVLMPGTGQFYYHHWMKGTAFFVAAMLLSAILRRHSATAPPSEEMVLHLALLGLAVWSAFDTFRTAESK